MYKVIAIVVTFLFSGTVCANAQESQLQPPDPKNPENENLEVPANWKVRTDRSPDATIGSDEDEADIYFVNMVPGWHITTGPAAIFYHPGSLGKDTYTAKAVIHLFEPERDREAFGIFIGGNNLDKQNQSYTYFLLRNTGEFLLKKRMGDDTETIQGWSEAPPMKRHTEETENSVENKLTIEVNTENVTFILNGEELASLPKSSLETDGIVGLRVNHGLNLHVSDLSITDSNL